MSQELARFRVLLIGRGNAGKTTILKKLCGETDVPIVRDRRGNLVSPVDSLNPSSERGNHDIEHEITYPSREKFAFHDSCGLESGSDVEMQRIADFIARRAKMSLENGLHAIWICIALDDSRPASRLFDITTGEVTTIFVFTKFDALETLSYVALIRQGRSKRQANAASSEYAEHVFQEQWIPLLKVPNPPPPPPYHVRLKDLHKPGGSCQGLTQITEQVLKTKNEELLRMFVMARRYALSDRLEYAVPKSVEYLLKIHAHGRDKMREELVKIVLSWMPHVYKANYSNYMGLRQAHDASEDIIRRFLGTLQYPGPLLPSQDLLQTIAGCAIIADNCFWVTERPEDMKYNPPSEKELEIGVQSALQAYRSRHQALIVNAIVEAFPEKDVLSLPVLERMHLKAREKSLEELGEKLTLLVLQNLMPRINQPIP